MLGKILGTALGYWFFGIPGAIIGFGVAYLHDRLVTQQTRLGRRTAAISEQEAEAIRQSFFATTFSVMGHVSKSDGQVRKSEIALAESIMQQMSLSADMRASAINLFNEGKHAEFDLDTKVLGFRTDCQQSSDLYRIFLQIQIQAALADGKMAAEEEAILLRVADLLGFPEFVFRQVEMLVRVSMGIGDDHARRYGGRAGAGGGQRHSTKANARATLQDAYTLLGVKPDDGKAVVKRAYRKMISEHHPDKLIAKGLPAEMIKLATDKSQQIQGAYESIKEAKGWN